MLLHEIFVQARNGRVDLALMNLGAGQYPMKEAKELIVKEGLTGEDARWAWRIYWGYYRNPENAYDCKV